MKPSKTKKVTFVNEKTLIVTVDIGKSIHYGYFRAPNNKEVKPFPFHNSWHSFEKFFSKICQFKKEQDLEDIVIGFESSGCYAEPLCHYLSKKPVKLVQINPMHTKRLKELTGNSPNKTDRKDTRVIADIISFGHALTVVVPEGAAAELRSLSHARERAVRYRTVASNQLQDLMFKIFPEFLSIMNNTSTKSAIYLMKNTPSPEDIVHLGLETLTNVLKKVSRGRLGIERAKELFEAALNSVGIEQGKKSILLEIEHLIFQIENKSRFIVFLEKQMNEYLKQIPYSRYLLSIRGISTITAGGLIGEVGDFKAFDRIREIEKLAGLNLYEVSSGAHRGRRHISKRGRSLMRKLLYYAAVNTVKSYGIMHEHYQKMIKGGKPKTKALIAIARRLLSIIFALVRNKTIYVDHYNDNHNCKDAA